MGVYIKNIYKPKACVDCIFWQFCDLWRNINWGGKPPEDCPIESGEVAHGHWIFDRYKHIVCPFTCSNCVKTAPMAYNYCPHCGAKMDVEVQATQENVR